MFSEIVLAPNQHEMNEPVAHDDRPEEPSEELPPGEAEEPSVDSLPLQLRPLKE